MFSFEDFFGFAMTLIKTRSNPVQSILKHDGDRLVLGMAKALIMHKAAGTNVCSVCVCMCRTFERQAFHDTS